MHVSRSRVPKTEREIAKEMCYGFDVPTHIRCEYQLGVRKLVNVVDFQVVAELAAIIEPAVHHNRHTAVRIDEWLPVDGLTWPGAPPSVRKRHRVASPDAAPIASAMSNAVDHPADARGVGGVGIKPDQSRQCTHIVLHSTIGTNPSHGAPINTES
jgi:hypothetical protein